jgi:hypothetical protein
LKPITRPLLAVLLCALAGCGGGLEESPIQKQVEDTAGDESALGFPLLATKNTTRAAGANPTEAAAGIARAVYPGFDEQQRPQAVTLVDEGDWQAAVAAGVLAAAPLRTPILLSTEGELPGVTADTIKRLRPRGSPLAGRAQIFRVGPVAAPEGRRSERIAGRDPFSLAAAIDAFSIRVTGQRSRAVVVASAEDPRFAMPAASWAAKSGDSVLFAERGRLPAATRQAIARRDEPLIYVLGPENVISAQVVKSLQRLGRVRRIGRPAPVENAIEFARYSDGAFGWGIRDPGHGLVIASVERPLDAAAASLLASNGTYGPLLLTDSATVLPAALREFLLDIQPGYQNDPARGVYNHAWLLGDEDAISGAVQGKIDELTEIVRVRLRKAQ